MLSYAAVSRLARRLSSTQKRLEGIPTAQTSPPKINLTETESHAWDLAPKDAPGARLLAPTSGSQGDGAVRCVSASPLTARPPIAWTMVLT